MILPQELVTQYDLNGPRYTSYPSADHFTSGFSETDYKEMLQIQNAQNIAQPLSIYIHLPFCQNICYYCACNKIITKDHRRSAEYIGYLIKEMDLVAQQFQTRRHVRQIHLGGGTPTFLSDGELEQLMFALGERFNVDDIGEYSIEIDPRHASRSTIGHLRKLGFNRMSLGVQDFDEKVQEAIHRIQPAEMTFAVLDEARKQGFQSINMDLIYGLPLQSIDSFSATLEQVISASPDRIALYNYAHLPGTFPPQRRINEATLPEAKLKIELLAMGVKYLTEAGYLYIGMDHFAKPDDELAIAQSDRSLERNFQGYSIYPQFDLIGLGVSAIGKIGAAYAQNVKSLEAYYARLDENRLPINRGFRLSFDDLLRRKIIQGLMCNFELDMNSIEDEFSIHFDQYFDQEIKLMQEFSATGLVEMEDRKVAVTPTGRYLIRPICMIFDAYLARRSVSNHATYSRTI